MQKLEHLGLMLNTQRAQICLSPDSQSNLWSLFSEEETLGQDKQDVMTGKVAGNDGLIPRCNYMGMFPFQESAGVPPTLTGGHR